MKDTPYKVFFKSECVHVFFVLDRWIAAPLEEIERAINNRDLQLYRNVTPSNVLPEHDVVYLEACDVNVAYGYEDDKRFLYLKTENNIQEHNVILDSEDFVNLKKEDFYQYYFLLSDISRLERENPEYLDPVSGAINRTHEQNSEERRADIAKFDAIATGKIKNGGECPVMEEKNKDWRREWGFLDYVLGLIEQGLSREDIAKVLIERGFSQAIVGAVTSTDAAQVTESALRARARALIGK